MISEQLIGNKRKEEIGRLKGHIDTLLEERYARKSELAKKVAKITQLRAEVKRLGAEIAGHREVVDSLRLMVLSLVQHSSEIEGLRKALQTICVCSSGQHAASIAKEALEVKP